MDTKLKKLLPWVIPPIAFFALFSLRFVAIAKATLYPDFSSEIFSVFLFGVIPSIVYLVSLFLYVKSAKKSSKRLVGIISAVIIAVLLCFEGYISLVCSSDISKTNDINNYLVLDDGSLVHNSDCVELLPVEVPEKADNPVYDYYCEFSLFSGSYVYAQWTLPENEYLEEKQRIIDSADEYKLQYFKYENQDVYAVEDPARDIAQFSFSDADYRISYYVSNGVVFEPLWEKQISE